MTCIFAYYPATSYRHVIFMIISTGKLQNRKSTWFFWLNALFFHFFRRINCEKFQFANNYKKSRLFFSTSERCKWDCRKSESLYLHFSCFIRLIGMSRSAEDKIVWIFIMLYNFQLNFSKITPAHRSNTYIPDLDQFQWTLKDRPVYGILVT